jgi:hypothetical protein
LVIRFGKLVGSTAAVTTIFLNLTPRSVNDLVDKNFELETLALPIRFHLNLGVRTQFLNHALRNEDFPAAIDPITELADEQP